jgi:transposase
MIDHLEVELDSLDGGLPVSHGPSQALMGRYGTGWLTAVAIWAEFGDVRRFATSRQAVRFCGLDILITEELARVCAGALGRPSPG